MVLAKSDGKKPGLVDSLPLMGCNRTLVVLECDECFGIQTSLGMLPPPSAMS